MNSCIWIPTQSVLGTPECICFFHDFTYEFMIFHEFTCELTLWSHIQTLLGTPNLGANSNYEFGGPKFIVFYELMSDITDFGLFSWEKSYSNSCLKNIVTNIGKQYREKYSNCMEVLKEFSIEFIGAVRGRAVFDRASPSCRFCSRAICPTIC